MSGTCGLFLIQRFLLFSMCTWWLDSFNVLSFNLLIWTCSNPQKLWKKGREPSASSPALAGGERLHFPSTPATHLCQVISEGPADSSHLSPETLAYMSLVLILYLVDYKHNGHFIRVFISHLHFFCELAVHMRYALFPGGKCFPQHLWGVSGSCSRGHPSATQPPWQAARPVHADCNGACGISSGFKVWPRLLLSLSLREDLDSACRLWTFCSWSGTIGESNWGWVDEHS